MKNPIKQTFDHITAKNLFKLLPNTMQMQVFFRCREGAQSIRVSACEITPIQCLLFLAAIDAECEVEVIVYENSFEFALAYNAVTNQETELLLAKEYAQEEIDAMYGESHFIQMLEATKDLF